MKLNKSVIALIFLTGCGAGRGEINRQFEPYIKTYENMSGMEVLGIDFDFKELEAPAVGQCEKKWGLSFGASRFIHVDPNYWSFEKRTEEQKMALIFHEIGHCLLDRNHTEDTMSVKVKNSLTMTKIPSSLMYPYVFYSSWYANYESYYYNELIHPETRRKE